MVHPTGITKLVDKLEAQGFVARLPEPRRPAGDPRRDHPARAGARAEEATRAVTAVRFGADLPDDDLEHLVALVQRWRLSAGDLGG